MHFLGHLLQDFLKNVQGIVDLQILYFKIVLFVMYIHMYVCMLFWFTKGSVGFSVVSQRKSQLRDKIRYTI